MTKAVRFSVMVSILSLAGGLCAQVLDPAAIRAKRDSQDALQYRGTISGNAASGNLTTFVINLKNGVIMFTTEGYADVDDKRITSYRQACGVAEEHARLRIKKEAAQFIAGGVLSYYNADDYMKLTAATTTYSMENVLVSGLILDTLYFERSVSNSGKPTPVAHLRMAYLLRDEDNPAVSGAYALFGSFVKSIENAGYQTADITVEKTDTTDKAYTSIIIDLTGFDFAPSLFPVITVSGESRRVVYSGAHLTQEFVGKYGTVCYLKNREDGEKVRRLCKGQTYNPLVVKAEALGGVQKGNIQISKESAVKLMSADLRNDVLKEGRVGLLVQ